MSKHRRLGVICICALISPTRLLPAAVERAAAAPTAPQVALGELFTAVETAAIFKDSKEFADAVPLGGFTSVLEDYRRARPESPQALENFVAAHFILPRPIDPAPDSPNRVSLTEHIDRLWDDLARPAATAPPYSSLLALPYAYVVPGGRFRELYYWDSYFTLLGLVQSGRNDLAHDMVRDFAYLIDTYGHVPNGTRTYYVSRSQPPFFFKMVELVGATDPNAAYARYLPQLRREYAYWMQGSERLRKGTAHRRLVRLSDGALLNRYWDDLDLPRDEAYREDVALASQVRREPRRLFREIRAAAESGWDFSSRWLADGLTLASLDTTEILPVDLNSLMFGMEQAIAAGCARLGDLRCQKDFSRRADERHKAIDRWMWNTSNGVFFDYRWTHDSPMKRLSAATLYPLFIGLASQTQADSVARIVAGALLQPGGLAATTTETGQQWDSPNGWAPLQWIAVDGLRRYGGTELASAIACRWLSGVQRVYRDTGRLVEKYDVRDTGRRGGGGEYPTQDGFGWTNGVARKLSAIYPECMEPRVAAVDGFASGRAVMKK